MLWPLQVVFIAAIIFCTPAPRLEAQADINRNNFLIEPNRPLVYVHVDHVGLGAPEEDGKRHERIWLELHNNCLLPIWVRTYGAPSGDSADAVGGYGYSRSGRPPASEGEGRSRLEEYAFEHLV
jgi:hypothetical protein